MKCTQNEQRELYDGYENEMNDLVHFVVVKPPIVVDHLSEAECNKHDLSVQYGGCGCDDCGSPSVSFDEVRA